MVIIFSTEVPSSRVTPACDIKPSAQRHDSAQGINSTEWAQLSNQTNYQRDKQKMTVPAFKEQGAESPFGQCKESHKFGVCSGKY